MEQRFEDSREQITRKAPLRVFFAASIVMFFFSFSVVDSIGFVPSYIDGSTTLTTGGSSSEDNVTLSDLPELGSEANNSVGTSALPDRIVIPAIGLDLPVQNPSTRNIEALDTLLRDGPVRYVDSAKLGEKGNALIFAHSSSLPVIRNEMFRAFNRVSELSSGDMITVTGDGESYIYIVSSVRRGDASDEIIDLSPKQGTKLTLVTCDTLTSKESRWILEAEFVGVL